MSLFRIAGLSLIVLLSACSSTEELETSEQQLYTAIQSSLRASQWDAAISRLHRIESEYPFGSFAEQAQLELVYAYYQSNEPDAAISAADRFIRLHPLHEKVDYAYYMRGLAAFTQSQSVIERFMPTDITQRDPGAARESFNYFKQLTDRYPDSIYSWDATQRMIYLRNVLARYELHVANYYFTRGAYVAALRRGQFVLENFPSTPAVPDALATVIQAYHLLDMNDLADENLAVLKLNYPTYPLLDDDGELQLARNRGANQRSWLNQLTFGLADRPEPPGFDTRIDGEFERDWDRTTPQPN
jgi:outer membrane protein assembly factor BamD